MKSERQTINKNTQTTPHNPNQRWWRQRCKGADDDEFAPCFGCRDETSKNGFYEYANNYHERQSGESFKVTNQSRRLICRRGARNCRLRVTRSIELRQRTYGRALQFVQSEQYLSLDDMDLIKYFLFFKLFFRKFR